LRRFSSNSLYNEQLYSLIVWSKPGLFTPWAKNHSQLKLLAIFFPLGQKSIANSTFYDTYLFQINLFFLLEVQFVARRRSHYYLHDPKILIEKAERLKIIFNCQHDI
jgi:hypothetical protein